MAINSRHINSESSPAAKGTRLGSLCPDSGYLAVDLSERRLHLGHWILAVLLDKFPDTNKVVFLKKRERERERKKNKKTAGRDNKGKIVRLFDVRSCCNSKTHLNVNQWLPVTSYR